MGVDRREGVLAGDQNGPVDDDAEEPEVDVAGPEGVRDPGEPLSHRAGVAQIAVAHRDAGMQGRGYFGGHRVVGVDRPLLTFTVLGDPQRVELADGHEPVGGGDRL